VKAYHQDHNLKSIVARSGKLTMGAYSSILLKNSFSEMSLRAAGILASSGGGMTSSFSGCCCWTSVAAGTNSVLSGGTLAIFADMIGQVWMMEDGW
jgi:hypothetical protein